MLLHLYATHAWPVDSSAKSKNLANGNLTNGHIRGQSVERSVRDAEEFELEGLMSEDEDGGQGVSSETRKENGRVT